MRRSLSLFLLCAAAGIAGAAPNDQAPAPPAPKAAPPAPKAAPAAAKTQVTWYGHAAFKIETPAGKTILVDPWFTNPTNPTGKDDVANTKADLILITHGHFDHVGDANEIATRTKAKLVTSFDLGNALVATGYPKEQFGMDTGGNAGGSVTVLDGEVTITFVPAVHSSDIHDEKHHLLYPAGAPGGFVIAVKGGPTLYHTGDTDVFGDMALIGKFHKIDLMLACIGDHFTMGPDRAAEAVRLVKPKQVAGMHYGTFPILNGTPDAFGAAMKKAGVGAKLVKLEVGKPLAL